MYVYIDIYIFIYLQYIYIYMYTHSSPCHCCHAVHPFRENYVVGVPKAVWCRSGNSCDAVGAQAVSTLVVPLDPLAAWRGRACCLDNKQLVFQTSCPGYVAPLEVTLQHYPIVSCRRGDADDDDSSPGILNPFGTFP